MNALRASPDLPLASTLHCFILSCCAVALSADRQLFMKALRSSPFLSPASALQVAILVCCFVFAGAASALAIPGASLWALAKAEEETASARAAATVRIWLRKF